MPTKITLPRWFGIVLRIGVGAVFIYAGISKIRDPLQFADNIASFRMLPSSMAVPLALGLPIFELISGALLVIGLFRRVAALGVLILAAVFFVAIASALARGLTIDCGCFGAGSIPTRARMWMDLARDLVLLAATAITYLSVWPDRFRQDSL